MPTMGEPDTEIIRRWRLYRQAREEGVSEVEAYDRYLHPGSRIPDDEVAEEAARAGLG